MDFSRLFRPGRVSTAEDESAEALKKRIAEIVSLAQSADEKKKRKMVIELHRTTEALTRKDILDWRRAWQLAINVEKPDRRALYDIYRDVDVDLHVSGCVGQRTEFVMSRSFKLSDASGKENEEAVHYFDQEWFKHLCRLVLQSIYYGHSLIELGDLTTDGDGCPSYDGVKLIPRKHVIPEYHRVIPDLGYDWKSGVDYREAPWTDWLVEAGEPDNLGLYLKAAHQTIPKKNMLAFWDAFGEIFGMPMRIARTTSRDEKEIRRLDKMLREAGASLSMVAGMDTEIQFVESSRGDAFNVYDKRVDRANSEISKLIIGQTMTLDDGSSLSQSQTHLNVFEKYVEADADMLRDVINNQLIPRMVKHGFPVKGLRFDWDYSIDYTPEQQLAIEKVVTDIYEVPGKYFEEKYGIPCGEPKQNADPFQKEEGDEDSKKPGDKKKQGEPPFFFD